MSAAIAGPWLWLGWEGQLCLAEVRSGELTVGGRQKLLPGWTLPRITKAPTEPDSLPPLSHSGSRSQMTHRPPFHLALTCTPTNIQKNWISPLPKNTDCHASGIPFIIFLSFKMDSKRLVCLVPGLYVSWQSYFPQVCQLYAFPGWIGVMKPVPVYMVAEYGLGQTAFILYF